MIPVQYNGKKTPLRYLIVRIVGSAFAGIRSKLIDLMYGAESEVFGAFDEKSNERMPKNVTRGEQIAV